MLAEGRGRRKMPEIRGRECELGVPKNRNVYGRIVDWRSVHGHSRRISATEAAESLGTFKLLQASPRPLLLLLLLAAVYPCGPGHRLLRDNGIPITEIRRIRQARDGRTDGLFTYSELNNQLGSDFSSVDWCNSINQSTASCNLSTAVAAAWPRFPVGASVGGVRAFRRC